MSTASRNAAIKDLLEWSAEEGHTLPTTPQRIVQLESQGYVVDLETGVVTRPERGQVIKPEAIALNARQWLAGLEQNGKVTIRWRVHPDEWFALHPPRKEPKEEAQG